MEAATATTAARRELFEGTRVAPSILSADFSNLGAQVAEVMDAGARLIHVDVLDVHLMIERPEAQIEEFAKAGADCITFHAEATAHANRTLGAIRELGCLAGIALNPGTAVDVVSELDEAADLVLCMTVNPGWGGQPFIATSPDKVARLREAAPKPVVGVDGGIEAVTVGSVAN